MQDNLPDSVREFLDAFRQPWQPVSQFALVLWLAIYALFLLYAAGHTPEFLFVDNANLVVHEAGHLLFGYLGQTLGLWGGTLLQLIVPALLTLSFAYRRQPTGTAFCSFFLFENLLYVAVYMADARAQQLPLVTVGDAEFVEHDWFRIFSSLGVLERDIAIAHVVRAAGWVGMLATVTWLVVQARRSAAAGA